MKTFPLATMDALFGGLTLALLVVPAAFLFVPVGAAAVALRGAAVLMALVYGSVWLWWRPGRFEVDGAGLTAVFPMRRRHTPAANIVRAEVLDMAAFRVRYPRAMRVGAGGLWGGFGWLWSRSGWIEFYISRLDNLVLIERRGQLPLLISPADPAGFVAALGS